jgi:DNA replication initiation complex subunit (GINS family)
LNDDYSLDYDELRKIYRLEVKSPKLTKLNPDFYKELKKFLVDERKRYTEEMEESFSPTSIKKFETLKKMIEKIREIRTKKCLNLCLMYSRTNDFEEEGLIDFEVDFAKGIIKLIDKQNEHSLNIFGVSKKNKKTDNLVMAKVKFIESIPAFIGADLKEYGPFEKEQVCEIPEDMIKILESKNLIKKID